MFTRETGNDDVVQIIVASGRQFVWQMGAYGNTVFAFATIGGAAANANPTTVKRSLESGQRYESVVQVRKDGVSAYLDGKLVAQWKTDFRDMATEENWKLRDQTKLGLGVHVGNTVSFSSIEIKELSGKGKQTR